MKTSVFLDRPQPVLARNANTHYASGLGDAVDRLQNAGDDLVGIAFRVRTAIFQITLVAILDEVNGHPDRSAAIGETIAELVDGLRFVQTGKTQVVIRSARNA